MWISLWTRILDLIAPRRCPCCGARLSITEDLLCIPCFIHLPRTRYWLSPLDNRLARLFWGHFPIERAASYIFYYPHSKSSRLILQIKYFSKPWMGVELGRYIATEIRPSGFFDGIQLLVPIPLTRKRQWQRGYNQSERIAQGISEITGIPVEAKALRRTGFKQSQTRLSPYDRKENVKEMFQLTHPQRIEGRHVLLIDDVITTGSTIEAAAMALLEANGMTVSVFSVGYTWDGLRP